MNTIIKKIEFSDWQGNPREYSVDFPNIDKIVEHRAQGEGDKLFWSVYFTDGHIDEIFNPNRVVKVLDNQLK